MSATAERSIERMDGATGDADPIDYGILSEFVGMHLRGAYEAAYADFVSILGEDAMPPGYFTILTLITRNPGINQTELGRAARRDKSSVTKALRYMEDLGLIERTRLEDDRRVYVSQVTEAGRVQQQRMEEKGRQHLARLSETIGMNRQEFIAVLKAIADGLSSRPTGMD